MKGIADVKVKFFCKKCGRMVTALGSSYHKTERGIRFSAVRRHYWKKHPEVWGAKVYKGKGGEIKRKMGYVYNPKIKRWVKPLGGRRGFKIMPKGWTPKGKTPRVRRKIKGGGKRVVRRIRRPKLFRTLGLRGVLMGGAIYALVAYLVRRFVPQAGAYTPALALAGAGLVKRSLLAPAIAMATGELITDLLLPDGLVTFPGIPAIKKPIYDL